MRLTAAIVALMVLPAMALAGPSIVGSMQGWDPADPNYDVAINGNGVYVLTKTLAPGDYEYKAVDGDAWGLDFPGPNQLFTLAGGDITWFVNLGANVGVKEGDEFVFDSLHPPTVAGDFQDEVGNPSDWDPASSVTEMSDPDLDDVWEYSVVVAPAGDYQCKVTLNKNWDQSTGDNVSFTSDGVNPVTFTYDMSSNTTTVSTEVVTQYPVDVFFTLCLPDTIDSFFDICVTGSHDVLTNWGDGVLMYQPCPDISPKLYEVSVTFPAGSTPYVEYKYKKDDCQTWEDGWNHSFTIDDEFMLQILPWDGWEYIPPECPDCSSPVEDSSWGTIKSLYK
jgi:hypothetical protein